MNSPVGFLAGTKIDCRTPNGVEVKANVETLRTGDMVKTLNDGFVPVRWSAYSVAGSVYKMSDTDLCVASQQSTLVETITDELRLKIVANMGFYNYVDGMNKIPASLDDRFSALDSSESEIWFFSLESAEDSRSYGIYANDVLAESVSINTFRSIGIPPLGNERP